MTSQNQDHPIPPTALDRVYGWVAPFAFWIAWLAARMNGASEKELGARTGLMPAGRRPLLWFHGASAGEMMAASRLVAVLRGAGLRFTAGYTTTNREGLEYLTRAGGPQKIAALVPFDVSRWIGRALDHWRPEALFLVETELWPRLILETHRRGVPIFSVSARIYNRDFLRYRLARPLIKPALRRLTAILAQNELERERFIRLGAAPERCIAAGNLKYLGAGESRPTPGNLRDQLKILAGSPVVVFGSVHDNEVRTVFAACDRLTPEKLRLIVAPRHRSAVAEIMREAMARGWRFARRTQGAANMDWKVLILDTIGELRDAYSLASVAVVGGGFLKHGGHNPLEPVTCGAPVLFGEHFGNFEFEAKALFEAAPEAKVANSKALGERLERLLCNRGLRDHMLDIQRGALPDGNAIARRYLEELSPWLEERCA